MRYLHLKFHILTPVNHYLLLTYRFIARLGFKERVWFEFCHFLVTAHVFLFKVVPVPGDKISLPLYESTESCESLLQVEWQSDLPHSKIFSALIMVCKLTSCAEKAWCLLASLLVSIVLCLGDQSICFTGSINRGQSKGSSNSKYSQTSMARTRRDRWYEFDPSMCLSDT